MNLPSLGTSSGGGADPRVSDGGVGGAVLAEGPAQEGEAAGGGDDGAVEERQGAAQT